MDGAPPLLVAPAAVPDPPFDAVPPPDAVPPLVSWPALLDMPELETPLDAPPEPGAPPFGLPPLALVSELLEQPEPTTSKRLAHSAICLTVLDPFCTSSSPSSTLQGGVRVRAAGKFAPPCEPPSKLQRATFRVVNFRSAEIGNLHQRLDLRTQRDSHRSQLAISRQITRQFAEISQSMNSQRSRWSGRRLGAQSYPLRVAVHHEPVRILRKPVEIWEQGESFGRQPVSPHETVCTNFVPWCRPKTADVTTSELDVPRAWTT
jgi:hypothetical protein